MVPKFEPAFQLGAGRAPPSLPRKRGRSPEEPASRAHRRALERRRAILKAAAQVFRVRGIERTGMRGIAAAADLSPANLYYYFESRDELLYFCQDHSLDLMLAALDAARAASRSPRERLERVIGAHLRLTLDELDGAAAHLAVDGLPPALRAPIVAKRDRYERAVRALVRAGVRDGSFAPCDASLVTRAILGALNWTAHWYRPDGAERPEALAAGFARYLIRGLLP